MEVSALIKDLEISAVQGSLTGEVSSVSYDSRKCLPNSLFVAIPGLLSNGHRFLDDAISRGARFIVHEEDYRPPEGITAIKVPDSRRSLGRLAKNFFGDPSAGLVLIGVTGTNGKTTVTYLLEAIFRAAGYNTGVLGTVNYRYGDKVFPASHTTPESYELQRILREMADGQVTHVVAEVSSHALDLRRVDDCAFDLGIFTNLTQDHLDYHGTMEAYYEAKKRLFSEVIATGTKKGSTRMIVNRDCPWGRRLIREVSLPWQSYGLTENCDVTASDYRLSLRGIEAAIHTGRGDFTIHSCLLGKHNLENILAATAAALACGVAPSEVKSGIEAMVAPPGRLEMVGRPGDPNVFVDYAHTDDALARVLTNLSELKTGRIITVFGCGGNRDRGKRPKMGAVAVSFSDVTILTSDNPRGEDPAKIIEDIEAGIKGVRKIDYPPTQAAMIDKAYWVEPDRRLAIGQAIEIARPQDIVLIAGKGHEDYQIIGSRRISFDDRVVAREFLDLRRRAEPGSVGGCMGFPGPRLSAADILRATGGALVHGRPEDSVCGVSTDSRSLTAGNLFVPLRGANFDGHDFLASALERGAGGFLFQAGIGKPIPAVGQGVIAVEVADTLTALGDLANFWRRQCPAVVIAITGSSGKSTVKEMTAQILQRVRVTLKTEGNFNNLIGLPLTLFRLHPGHQVAVVELGMNVRGEIRRLTSIAEPDIGVITNVGPAHLENLKTLEAIREEKGDLFRTMGGTGLAVINKDDENIRIIEQSWSGRRLTFGLCGGTDVTATDIRTEGLQGISFTLWIEGVGEAVTAAVAGLHNVSNALAAAACAWAYGLPREEICQGLREFRPMAGRISIKPLRRGSFLIDDAYNANPASMREAINTLFQLKGNHRAVAILGDMLELGEKAADYHEEIGRLAAERGLAALFLKGDFGRYTARGALKGGMGSDQIRFFDDPGEVPGLLGALEETWILVKGSRSMRLERVVKEIEAVYAQ